MGLGLYVGILFWAFVLGFCLECVLGVRAGVCCFLSLTNYTGLRLDRDYFVPPRF